MRSLRLALITPTAPDRDVDKASLAMQAIAWLIDHPKDFMPRRDRPAVAKYPKVAATEGTGPYPKQDLACRRDRQRHLPDFNLPVTCKSGCLHHA
jgi:hypothetical protein